MLVNALMVPFTLTAIAPPLAMSKNPPGDPNTEGVVLLKSKTMVEAVMVIPDSFPPVFQLSVSSSPATSVLLQALTVMPIAASIKREHPAFFINSLRSTVSIFVLVRLTASLVNLKGNRKDPIIEAKLH